MAGEGGGEVAGKGREGVEEEGGEMAGVQCVKNARKD